MRDSIPASHSASAVVSEYFECLACEQSGARVFFELDDIPVLCNAPCATPEAALAFPRGRIELAFCPHCGLVFNRAFSPELLAYDQQYENSLHFSRRFDDYIRDLAQDLVERLDLRSKDIIEIGCGKGDFLALLCELGDNRGVGFDPTYEPDRLDALATGRMRIVRDLYTETFGHLACDLLCCRQTLEHMPAPAEFLRTLRQTLGSNRTGTVVFFEVPNALYTIRHKGIWDIIYEHVSYFWAAPLSQLFARSGFSIRIVKETYGQQFLCLEAVPDQVQDVNPFTSQIELDRVAEEIRIFGGTFRSMVQSARSVLETLEKQQQRAVIWGSGSKGVTFLNIFKDHNILKHAVDINPHKQGKYIPGTGHAIVGPESLREIRPDVVFLMNPLYRDEIASQLADLSVSAELVAV